MSEPAIRAEIHLSLRDTASAGLTQVSRAAQQAATLSSKAAVSAASQAVQANEQMVTKSRGAFEKLSSAREALGIRSEQAVRREIQLTEAAYNRLARSGIASAHELARAQDASIAKVRMLRREMGEVDKTQRGFGVSPGAATAAVGAYMLAKPAVTRAVDYDHTVAGLTNTMFNDRDAAGRESGKAEIKTAIQDALKMGGGTREQAAGTLSELMGSGEFSKEQAYKLLGTIQKGSTASGADSGALANIALAAKRMGVPIDEMNKVISKSIRAGELGGFELGDMAKHLPDVLSNARNQGLHGMKGLEAVLVSLQASVLTAGTKDAAAINLNNLFSKLDAQETSGNFKKHGIDLNAEYVKGAVRGEDKMTTFARLTEQVVNQDPKMRAATAELARLSRLAEDKKNPQREDLLKQIQQIYRASGTATILHDYQATQGFRAVQQGEKSGLAANVRTGLAQDNAGQELNTSYSVMANTASAKLQTLENSKLQGQDELLTATGSAMKPLFDGVVSVAEKFPVLTASVSAATVALGLLSAAAMANVLAGKAGGAGGVLDKAAGVVTNGASGVMQKALGAGVAWDIGYNGIGPILNTGIDKLITSLTGHENSLGGFIFDALHSDALAPKDKNESHVKVELTVPEGMNVKSQQLKATGNTTLDIATGSMWGMPL
ncbi:MAG: phage tail tape measure protein [Gallionella sp.]